jgi:hypothetical protein
MTENHPKPFWNIGSLILQLVAILAAIGVGIVTSEPESLRPLLFMVPTYCLGSLLGVIAALRAIVLDERWLALSWIALVLNAIPFIWMFALISHAVG